MCAATQEKPAGRLSAEERIKKRGEFLEIQGRGSRFVTLHLVFFWKTTDRSTHRVGVTASRKVGKAVRRNTVKRRIREVFRVYKNEPLPCSVDVVVVARPSAFEATFVELEEQWSAFVRHLRQKAGGQA